VDGTVRRAELTGTDRVPLVRLWFNRHDTLKGGRRLLDAVRALPRAQFDGEAQCWVVSATGRDPDRLLQRWGFEIDLEAEDPSLAGVQSLGEVFDPLLRLSAKQPGVVLVRPRLAGFARTLELLGPGARWDKATQRFEVPVADLVDDDGDPLPGLVYGRGIVQEARRRLAEPKPPREAAVLASVTSMGDAPGAAAALVDAVGDVPDWFGLDLYGYQRTGAIAAAAGLAQLGDEPGLGKTRTALAAAAIRGVERLLVVSPPVMLSGWEREATLSRAAGVGGRLPGAEVVVITPRRKEPDLPRRGVVIVSDSLLASREALAKRIRLWAPDGLIVDEVHRLKTWDSARGRVVRAVAEAVGDGPRLAISGTPLFANPVELASTLAITGQLDPVFGGMGRFCAAFARQNKYKAWVARKRELPRLRSMLDQYVWVRRHKEDVLTDLPAKSRREMVVDVDLSGFRAAHREVTEVVEGWVEEFLSAHGRLPEAADIAEYARDSIGLTSQLRKAAGLAKVDAATEYIVDWVASNETTLDEQGRTVYDRPLVVWTHHRVVSTAMAEAVPDAVGGARVIMGGISKAEQASIVDDFQAGLVPVLVASITAAGVGITLTRSSDALFVETDWTPALVLQAEDRTHRVTQTRPVTLTTMVAPGTLDEQVQKVLAAKAKVLEPLLGEGQDVSVIDTDDEDELTAPAEIVFDIADRLVVKRRRSRLSRAA